MRVNENHSSQTRTCPMSRTLPASVLERRVCAQIQTPRPKKRAPFRGPVPLKGCAKSSYSRSMELPKFSRTPNSKKLRTLGKRKLGLLGSTISCAKIAARLI
jgi:hypothetical protein